MTDLIASPEDRNTPLPARERSAKQRDVIAHAVSEPSPAKYIFAPDDDNARYRAEIDELAPRGDHSSGGRLVET